MRKRRFRQVDVFTDRPYYGNPVAVVIDAEGLDADEMQRIARWTNLSETTFVLPPTHPEADYRLRIFTPSSELAFAGHPSVGSAHAAIEAGVVESKPRLIQECGAGLLPVAIDTSETGRRIFVTAPPARSRVLRETEVERVASAIGARPMAGFAPLAFELGPTWIVMPLDDAAVVSRLAPDMTRLAEVSRELHVTGVTAFGRFASPADAAINVRAFAPAEGVPEDPVCGSGNAAVGYFVARTPAFATLAPGYVASQGREIGRDGRVAVRLSGDRVEIGGFAVTCVDGAMLA